MEHRLWDLCVKIGCRFMHFTCKIDWRWRWRQLFLFFLFLAYKSSVFAENGLFLIRLRCLGQLLAFKRDLHEGPSWVRNSGHYRQVGAGESPLALPLRWRGEDAPAQLAEPSPPHLALISLSTPFLSAAATGHLSVEEGAFIPTEQNFPHSWRCLTAPC